MKLDAPRSLLLYCQWCESEHVFRYSQCYYRGHCGKMIHPLNLWALYSSDDYVTPAYVMVPRRLLRV